MRLGSLLVAAAVAALLSNPVAGADGARRPPSPEIEAKITDLIARMTLEV